ncbi:MAG: HD domain-containing protein [Phycisphaeraceae bacterium]|nr:HD domain-containing protein [Phycisphaeraceae bacterium]
MGTQERTNDDRADVPETRICFESRCVIGGPANPGGGPVVLLVDDQPIFGKSIGHLMAREADIEFYYCRSAADIPKMVEAHRPTVILQDLVMPDADGLDLIGAYREHEATRQTPLVVLSSDEEPRTKAEAFRRGANDYMVKPPERIELIARVRYHDRAYRLILRAEALHDAETQRLRAERQADALRSRNTLIFALAKLAESRDTDTGEHLERIAAYCRVLAEQLRVRFGLTDGWIRNLQLASSLHDIGKVGIPDAVLLKPGRLTPEERRIIERHPEIGAVALDAILAQDRPDDLLMMARNIAASHHERWDGAGYPRGLAGGDIPLEARIVSVADVYDALTTKRVYKPALGHGEAVGMISGGRGTQFDPEIVDALLACEAVFQHAAPLLHGEGPIDQRTGDVP